MTKHMTLLSVLVVALMASSSASRAAPPALEDLGKLSVDAGVGPAAINTITTYLEHWVGVMAGAKSTTSVTEATAALIRGHEIHTSASYRYEYAKKFAEKMPPLLKLDGDALRLIKETNAAMVAAAMSQITTEPALAAMAKHRNPAVRYWAAKGYRHIGSLLLVQPGGAAKMLKALEQMGPAETSGPVVAAVLHAASGYPNVTGAQAGKLRLLLAKVWLARCGEVHAGNVEMIGAFRKAAKYLTAASKDEEKLALQLLIDVMESASLAMLVANNQKEPRWAALAELVTEAERRFAGMTGLQRTPIADILKGAKTPDLKAVAVRLQVNAYKKWLQTHRAIKPRFKPAPAATTQPATQPAG